MTIKSIGRIAAGACLSVAALLGASGTASAGLLLGAQQEETSVDEDGIISPFVWSFSGVGAGTGMASLEVDFARLDLDGVSEAMRVLVDGVQVGTFGNGNFACVTGVDATAGTFVFDCSGSASFSFDTSFLSDGNLIVTVESARGVNSLIDTTNGAGWASIAIRYDDANGVPEPASVALLGLALIAAGAGRRRKG